MTPQEQRIALAEADGYRWVTTYRPAKAGYIYGLAFLTRDTREDPKIVKPGRHSDNISIEARAAPNYLRDREAVTRLLLKQDNLGFALRYVSALHQIIHGNSTTSAKHEALFCASKLFKLLTATAEQMAEAFLKAKGIWK